MIREILENINEEKLTEDIKALNAINKFILTLNNPKRYDENKFHDYRNSKIVVKNRFTGEIDFFGSIVKKSSESAKVPVIVEESHTEIIGGDKVTDVSITVSIQLGDNPGSINFHSDVKKFTINGIKKSFKEVIDEAKKDSFSRVKILSKILRYKQPLSSNDVSKSLNMGVGSASSVKVNHSYNRIIDIKELTKIFSEKEFKEAVKSDFGLKRDNVSFDFKKGLMDRSGTWVDTWD